MSRSPVRIAITCDTQRLGCKLLVNLLKINGAEPVVIPTLLEAEDGFFKFNTPCEELKKKHLEKVSELMKGVDALILPGNKYDLHPSYYKDDALHPKTLLCDNPCNLRFDSEFIMARYALFERPMPILAICGGMQLLNVILGGSLVQDLTDDRRTQESGTQHCDPNFIHKPDIIQETLKERFFRMLENGENANIFDATHGMEIVRDSELARLYRKYAPELDLSDIDELSIHHQGLFKENLSKELKAVAYAPDGLIEAAEIHSHPKFNILTQFHVEYNVSRLANPIVQELIKSV
jgi:gamma-glutamyl-gamma-aminobutyrate hydrolase PuuD